ncbi:MAG TPA: hypothetical protein VHK68_12145 [Gemmatimonadales bacterium]|nr:hypothetical protein [Gemmatimonadales bacterium]
MKVASFTLHATADQSARWKRAAEAEGYASVGTWASRALDAYLKQRLVAGAPVPLAWSRGTVRAILDDGNTYQLRGWISPPFGFFHGSAAGLIPHGSTHLYTLCYTPTGRLLATFRYAAHCKALASDLARVWVRWDGAEPSEDPAPLLQRFEREAF